MSISVQKLMMGTAGAGGAGNPYGEILNFGGSYALYAYDFDSESNLYGAFVGPQQKHMRLNAETYTRQWEKRISTSTTGLYQDCSVNNNDDVYFVNQSDASDREVYLSLLDGATGAAIGNQHHFDPPAGDDYTPIFKGKSLNIFDSPSTAGNIAFMSTSLGTSLVSATFDNTQASETIGERYADMNTMLAHDSCIAAPRLYFAGAVQDVITPRSPILFKSDTVLLNYGCSSFPVKYSGTAYSAGYTCVNRDAAAATTSYDLAVSGNVIYNSKNTAFVAVHDSASYNNIRAFRTFYNSSGVRLNCDSYVKSQIYDGFVYVVICNFDIKSDWYFVKLAATDLSIEWQYKVSGFNTNSQPFGKPVLMRNINNDLFFSTRYEAISFSRDGLPVGTFGSYTVSESDLTHDPNFTLGPYTTIGVTSGNLANENSFATNMFWLDTTDVSATPTLLE